MSHFTCSLALLDLWTFLKPFFSKTPERPSESKKISKTQTDETNLQGKRLMIQISWIPIFLMFCKIYIYYRDLSQG